MSKLNSKWLSFRTGNKDLFKKIKSDLTEIIHELISTRNKLFKTLDNLNLHSLAKNPDKFRAKDFGKMLKVNFYHLFYQSTLKSESMIKNSLFLKFGE